MMDCISSALGASMKAKPLDSCVSGLRMTLIESATRAFRVEPGLNIVRGHPDWKIAKKDSETHSRVLFTPLVGLLGSYS